MLHLQGTKDIRELTKERHTLQRHSEETLLACLSSSQ